MGLDFKAPCKFTLSANELRQYSDCARKRYYSSRDCLAIRSNGVNTNLEVGKAVHMAFQFVYTTVQQMISADETLLEEDSREHLELLVGEAINNIVTQLLDEQSEGPKLAESDKAVVKNVVGCYKETFVEDLIQFEILGCEQSFHMENWPIGDVMYHGDIDMVVLDRTDGKIYFFEHKTCTNFRPDIYNRFDIQMHIYDAYGYEQYKGMFGGMILNQVKKAKTTKGFALDRSVHRYDEQERSAFFIWITKKTSGLVSPNNLHEPCNTYMTCKMCEYSDLCLKFGYGLPDRDSILNSPEFEDETGNPMFRYDPRESEGGEE